MDVAIERFLATVNDLHGALGAQRQQAGMDVHAQVLASAEGAAHTTEVQANLLARQVQTGSDLVLVDV